MTFNCYDLTVTNKSMSKARDDIFVMKMIYVDITKSVDYVRHSYLLHQYSSDGGPGNV